LIKRFFLYFAASLFIGVPFALLSGIWPKSLMGWVFIAIFGFPTLILGEFLGEKLFSQRISHALDPTKRDKLISLWRMAYALAIGVTVTALIILLGYLLCAHIAAYFTIA
jgi:hypothetical protein